MINRCGKDGGQGPLCPVCMSTERVPEMKGKTISGYLLSRCRGCGLVVAFPAQGDHERFSYEEYGEYLEKGSLEIREMLERLARRHSKLLRRLEANYSRNARFVDFGAGAGYFVRVAREYGFSVEGVEISGRLRKFSEEKLGIALHESIAELGEGLYDGFFMFEVVEHLDPAQFVDIMKSVHARLRTGGFVCGTTPNYGSLNILLSEDRDPAIAPPSHIQYFTPRSLDNCLGLLGFERLTSVTRSVSSNSFFRKEKFKKSFLEVKPSSNLANLFVRYPLIALFRLLGILVSQSSYGYRIEFFYRKK